MTAPPQPHAAFVGAIGVARAELSPAAIALGCDLLATP
jgi:hypothetical protein